MKVQNAKLLAAIVIASVGLVALGRMILSQRPAPAPSSVEIDRTTETIRVAEGSFDTVPTEASVARDIQNVRSRALDVMTHLPSSQLPASRRRDLADAFRDRFAAVIDPNTPRDAASREARGQPPGFPTPDGMTNLQAIFRLRSFDLASLEVVTIFHRGKRIAPMPITGDGLNFGTTKYNGKWAFPMSELDPIEDRLTIVEVRLPMDTPIPPPGENASERKLIGFQFVWSNERNQWIPWANVDRGGTGGSYGVPF